MILRILFILLLIPMSLSFAQEIQVGDPATHKSLDIRINQDGNANVTHLIKSGGLNHVILVSGDIISEILVTNEDDDIVQFAHSGNNETIVLFPHRDDIKISYTLGGVVNLINDTWTWEYQYLTSTNFYFPDHIDKVYTNDIPISLDDVKGVKCHGCQVILEYTTDKSRIFDVIWEEEKFKVHIDTADELSNFVFNQMTKTIQFDIKHGDRNIEIIIPTKLLGEPYQVYVNDDEFEIFNVEQINNSTTTIYIKPSLGTVQIIGTSVIPEFPVYLLIFAISMMSVLLFTSRKIIIH